MKYITGVLTLMSSFLFFAALEQEQWATAILFFMLCTWMAYETKRLLTN